MFGITDDNCCANCGEKLSPAGIHRSWEDCNAAVREAADTTALGRALRDVRVEETDINERRTGVPAGWHSVTDEKGVRAYFKEEADACFYRLALVNARLNPIR